MFTWSIIDGGFNTGFVIEAPCYYTALSEAFDWFHYSISSLDVQRI